MAQHRTAFYVGTYLNDHGFLRPMKPLAKAIWMKLTWHLSDRYNQSPNKLLIFELLVFIKLKSNKYLK